MKILHLIPHLGTGVGTVVLNFLEYTAKEANQIHEILLLDYINEDARSRLSGCVQFYDRVYLKREFLRKKIDAADVVLVHWWNHPLLTNLIVNHDIGACRLIFWSHISGLPAPNCFCESLLNFPDRFIFTTPVSLANPLVSEMCFTTDDVIWSTGGVERVENFVRTGSKQPNLIAYVGNLDFTKIHPQFIDLCTSVSSSATFEVVGRIVNSTLQNQSVKKGISERVHFLGYVSETYKWGLLNRASIFGYPLARHHYATCDQSIQEAMAFGVVPVVLDNAMESYMIQDRITGLIAEDENQYGGLVNELLDDHRLRKRLSVNAQEFARTEYSLASMKKKWDLVFDEVLSINKSEHHWTRKLKVEFSPEVGVFLESLGTESKVFIDACKGIKEQNISDKTRGELVRSGKKHNWNSDTKSTVHQFSSFFPNDYYLSQISRIMRDDL